MPSELNSTSATFGWTADELKQRQEKVQEMLKRNEPDPKEQEAVDYAIVESAAAFMAERERKRKQRSDKGQKRKPEPAAEPQKAGAITQEQADSLHVLIQAEFQAREAFREAEALWRDAREQRIRFVDSLTKP